MNLVSDLKRRKWLGGYVREGKRGPVFVIERWIGGDHHHVSTRCRTERAALAELARWEEDPTGYEPQAAARQGAAVITGELINDFKAWQLEVRKVSPTHARDCAHYLDDWMAHLAGKDLRRVDLHRDIKAQLDVWATARKVRIVALKSFTAWLRREKGLLARNEDPTIDLQVPPSRPEKLERRKAVSRAVVEAVLPHLRADVRDLVVVLAATGLHSTEVRRFAAGEGELHQPTPAQQTQGVVAYLTVKHKTGRLHPVALVSEDVLAALLRLRAKGIPAHSTVWFCLRDACDAAQVVRFNAGVLRHSVATWLHEEGYGLDLIAQLLGHRDKRTTDDFYRDMGHTAPVLRVPALRIVKG